MTNSEQAQATVESVTQPRFSWVWAVPLLVIAIAASTLYRSYAERGVSVEIHFSQGKGIEAGKTEIRYKDVTVGVVDALRLSDDLEGVIASATLDRQLESFLGDTTDFWIVSAQISGTTFRGLSTLLSGAYIEIDWSGEAVENTRVFSGLLEPPLTPPSVAGTHFAIESADTDSVSVGSPVVLRGITVGQVERRDLSEDFENIQYQIFIESPYDSLIDGDTRFYDVSGIDLSLTADGLTLEIASLQTLASGGITFTSVANPGGFSAGVAPTTGFRLYRNQREAEESRFEAMDAAHFYFTAAFDSGVEGLEPGAPVVWQGVRLGTVTDVSLDLGDQREESQQIVTLDMQPARIGLSQLTEEESMADFSQWVESGMRAEVQTANLLTGKKRLALVDRPESPSATIDLDAQPYPRLPTHQSEASEISGNVGEIAATLSDLPLDDLISSAILLLQNSAALLGSEDTKAVPGALVEALSSMDQLAGSLDTAAREGEKTLTGLSPDSALYVELTRTVRELNRASKAITALTTLLEEKPNALITGG
ncbi:MAG: MlaD family protein [Pseudomonadota bacterium]